MAINNLKQNFKNFYDAISTTFAKGNHTVKSDVPENAKFTDTVYDDTELFNRLSAIDSSLKSMKSKIQSK